MNAVAIIPARLGSKRIPRKNIRHFAGKPIINYSIEAALQTNLFDKILISTDSEEIARVVRQAGAQAPFLRSPELSDDYTGTDAVVLHALNWLMERGEKIDYVCCLYATAPFVQPADIIKGYHLLRDLNATSAFSVTTFHYTIFRALKLNHTGRLEMIWPDAYSKRSQDFPETYHDAGQFYWAQVDRYLQEKKLFSRDAVPVVLPRYRVQDIDTPEDWEAAEMLYNILMKRK
jgi:pseudaminic acid cytidylyltransferase